MRERERFGGQVRLASYTNTILPYPSQRVVAKPELQLLTLPHHLQPTYPLFLTQNPWLSKLVSSLVTIFLLNIGNKLRSFILNECA